MSVYLLTGASRGIGLELARQLSASSYATIIAVIRTISDELQTLQKQCPNIRILTADVSSLESIAALSNLIHTALPHNTQITHIINNAAIVAGASSSNITTNVLGPAKVIEAALSYFTPNDGIIVNITSGIASLRLVSNGTIPANVAAYSISKSALNMLTVHVAQALRGKARVVCLDPGHVKTRIGGDKAVVEIEDSAQSLIRVIESLSQDEHGDKEKDRERFLNFRGQEVP